MIVRERQLRHEQVPTSTARGDVLLSDPNPDRAACLTGMSMTIEAKEPPPDAGKLKIEAYELMWSSGTPL